MGLASRGLCPPLESAEGTWARLFGGAVRRRRWEQTVGARTHTAPRGRRVMGKKPFRSETWRRPGAGRPRASGAAVA